MITFERMNEKAYQDYMEFMLPDYAQDIATHFLISLETATEDAEQQMEKLLPDGVQTEGHYFYHVKKKNEIAGYLWYHVDAKENKAYLYHIFILEKFRRQGIAKVALTFFEEEAKKVNVASLGLNVFGSNENALELYKKLGYFPAAISMNKIL
ncbi:GNAT family N-acetyltransferase [Fictibacillus nanhaiensis]|uniref:GNAT family N-acetyltransferase n=1 Tax=Fictibacillus nanhaiensis TaxID=742169 RepID=UPI001C97371B|nr:GNAT family N-acetyltransferase [Fictibacillus nanhaiensis]MBY6037712.1 GNAT family N-acetyltransferase [Fictibacillus nanhaiensis]